MQVNAGPRDAPDKWNERLKEEIAALIAVFCNLIARLLCLIRIWQYVNVCTESDNQWFHLEPSEDGLR